MGNSEIREPIQKRSIEKKEKIIHSGFELICEKGYYNTGGIDSSCYSSSFSGYKGRRGNPD